MNEKNSFFKDIDWDALFYGFVGSLLAGITVYYFYQRKNYDHKVEGEEDELFD